MEMGPTTVALTVKSSDCPEQSGNQHQHSEPGVVRPSTQTVTVSCGNVRLNLDAETVQVLMCLLEGFMRETLSGDITAMAFYAAKDRASKIGVPEEKFVEVANAIFAANDRRRKKHPLVASGFIG